MLRIDPMALDRPWPLFDAAASRAIEAAASSSLPPHTLMRRAGLSVARLALALAPHARVVWVAAGPGNNGGDGFEAALHLQRAGKRVHLTACGDVARRPDDARDAFARVEQAGLTLANGPPEQTDLVIDALLGLGTTRAPEGALAATIAAINRCDTPRLAIDLPSGLSGDTGQTCDDLVVAATHTLALLTLKPGLFTADGRDAAGDVWFDMIGSEAHWGAASARARLVAPDTARRVRPLRAHGGHKGRFGDVIVIGGAPGMAGAVGLAGRAALAAGAGRVFISPLDASTQGFDPGALELMFRPGLGRDASPLLDRATVVCGCGGGDAVRDALPAVLSRSARLVLDADALNAVATDAVLQTLLQSRAARGLPSVLTPHPLEAARLLGHTDAAAIQADRLAAAEALAARFGAIVVLKGSGSVIAAPGRTSALNPTGSARLATAGTGDVLAGWLGGLWASAPAMADAFDVALAAVWQHGAAVGSEPSRAPLRAGALIEVLAAL